MEPGTIPLRDLHLPDAIGIWPLAPGWWVLIALLVAGLAVAAWHLWRRFRHGRARRIALRQLRDLRARYELDGDAVAFAAAVSELLRRAMLAYAPRDDVAGLTGKAWVEWLDRDLGIPQFDGDAARGLLELPYRRPGEHADDVDIDRFVDAVRIRLLTPVREMT